MLRQSVLAREASLSPRVDAAMPSSVHDLPEPSTCRKCGALVATQTTQCRRCGRYRDAGPVESALLSSLVPTSMNAMAGTLILMALIVIWQLVVVVATRGDAFPALSSYTLAQFGAMNGPMVLFGQWWRAATSVFLHHDLIHILMNLYALAVVGPALERFTDRYRVWAIFLLGGVLSMLGSHLWYGYGPGGMPFLYVSAGASGAVCALIGAAYVYARANPQTGDLARRMLMWSVLMLAIGLFFGGLNINNAAHISGWVAGALLQWTLQQPKAPSLVVTRAVSGVMFALLIASFILAGLNMRGSSAYLAQDAMPRRGGMFMPSTPGVNEARSDQQHAWTACRQLVANGDESRANDDTQKAVDACRTNARINSTQRGAWQMLQLAYMDAGDEKNAQKAQRVSDNLRR